MNQRTAFALIVALAVSLGSPLALAQQKPEKAVAAYADRIR